jgi:hypothetical protein
VSTLTRKGFLKRAAGGAVVGSAALAPGARAQTVLDASFTSPYAPNPTLNYPSSWNVYTALIPGVTIPYDVVLCNRSLSPLGDVDGGPDLSDVPADATMLVVFHRPLEAGFDVSRSIPLNGTNMQFGAMGGGNVNWWGFRQFLGWWTATVQGALYSLVVLVYVGPEAGSDWTEVQDIVNSVRLAS